MLRSMTTTRSMFACTASDVTLDRVRDLVANSPLESLTLEFKERYTPNVVKSIAAMANSYGGLIIIGVSDKKIEDRLVGAPEGTLEQVANACHDTLEPPWEPEVIPLPLPGSNNYMFVIRVDADSAPRPVLVDGSAPIRLHGKTAKANRSSLAQLFREGGEIRGNQRPGLPRLQLNEGLGGIHADFGVRSGLVVRVGEAASWRPLPERGIDALIQALNNSPLSALGLKTAGDMGGEGLNPFKRSGLNRARTATLVWQSIYGAYVPIEMVARLWLPADYGVHPAYLHFTLDVEMRANSVGEKLGGSPHWRLSVHQLRALLGSLQETLVSEAVTAVVSDLAGVDSVLVPQPSNCDFITAQDVKTVLYTHGLKAIEEAGESRGANLSVDPALDLRNPREREEQVDRWIQQIALDAGLAGMDALLTAKAQE